jgi:hypothetical protein
VIKIMSERQGFLIANLIVFGFCLKLYTEMMKEKAQRERANG